MAMNKFFKQLLKITKKKSNYLKLRQKKKMIIQNTDLII